MHPLVASIPYPLARDLLAHPGVDPVGREQRFTAVALFVDVAGFTPLSEALARHGRAGTEELTALLNTYFGAAIARVELYGGMVVKFGGDALTALFPYTPATRPAVARRALQCALELQAELPGVMPSATRAGPFRLATHMGLAAGPVLVMTVGDRALRLQAVIAGSVLGRCAEAETYAQPGEVAAGRELLDGLDDAETTPLNEEYVRVLGLADPAPHAPLAPLPDLSPEALSTLAAYVHPAIARRLAAGQSSMINEHRRLTILFVDFGGLDYDNDPQVGARLQAYLLDAFLVIGRYDGYLKEVEIGDKGSKYIVLFGAPVAHEDEEERALRCALELRALGDLPVRIGVNTGLVYCGQVGSARCQDYTAMGDAMNLAARLMTAAAPGTILVSAASRQPARERFAWEHLAPIQVKGKSAPVTVYRLAGRRGAAQLRLPEPAYRLPMVGREPELRQVSALLDETRAGAGRVLGVVADAGLGKSRLAAEIVRLAGRRGFAAYVGYCPSYGAHSPYLAWQPVWQELFGLDPTWPAAWQIEHLEAQLAAIDPDLVSRLPLLGTLLNLAIPGNGFTEALDPKLHKESLEALLIAVLRAWVAGPDGQGGSPLLLVLDDCHWIDPLSLDLLEVLGRVLSGLPILLLLLYRPSEPGNGLGTRLARLPRFAEIRLAEFTAEEAAHLIELKLIQLFGPDTPDPVDLRARITARAEGNPFYIEELINYLHDQGIDPADPAAVAALAIPESLQQLLISRLDQLSADEQNAVKVASVIGRVFKAAWLWGSYPELGAPATVQAHLTRLSRLDITPLDKTEPELEYLFKHILTRDVAYESLAYATRAQLHGAVAAHIERTYAGELDRWLDLLAYHYGLSTNTDKQREYFRRAGEAAQAAYANATAISYYERLLPLLDAAAQLPVLGALGGAWQLIGKWDTAETIYRQALTLAEQGSDRTEQAACQVALGDLLRQRGHYGAAQPYLDAAQETYTALGDATGCIQALRAAGRVQFEQGDYPAALACFTGALDLAAGAENRQLAGLLRKDLADVYSMQCDYAEALAEYTHMRALAEETGDRVGLGRAVGNMGMIYLEQAAYASARAHFQQWLQLAQETGDRLGESRAVALLGRAHKEQGENLQALERYEQWLQLAQEIGNDRDVSYAIGNIGTVYGELGDYPCAFSCQEYKLAVALAMTDRPSICIALENMTSIRLREARYAEAERLSACAVALSRALNARYVLSYTLQTRAELAARQGRYTSALAANADALALAEPAGIHEIVFKAQLLAIRLQCVLGQITPAAAADALHALLVPCDSPSERAAIYYELAQLDSPAEARRQAADLYQQLYTQTFNAEYRERYEALTGARLPEPPPLPPLPALVTQDPVDLDALLRQVEDLLTQLAGQPA